MQRIRRDKGLNEAGGMTKRRKRKKKQCSITNVITLKPNSTRSCRFRAAWVQVIAMIFASFTNRYLDLSRPLRRSSNALNSCGRKKNFEEQN